MEAALTNDPDNEELLKLKEDLSVSQKNKLLGYNGHNAHSHDIVQEVRKLTLDLLELAPEPKRKEKSSFDWKTGDPCRAIWTENGRYGGENLGV